MNRERIIVQKLSALKPQYLKVTNNSHLHHGHALSPGSGESHFTITIKADLLEEKKLLEQHKIINDLLKEEFNDGLHALSIKILNRRR